jgi:predicted nucleotidyltransferase
LGSPKSAIVIAELKGESASREIGRAWAYPLHEWPIPGAIINVWPTALSWLVWFAEKMRDAILTSSSGSRSAAPQYLRRLGIWLSLLRNSKELVKINSDFKDLLRLFVDESVRFLVVGGYAVIKYTEPYYTKDLDIWIEASPENAKRALRALTRFGAPTGGVTLEELTDPDLIYQIGIEPVRIDVMAAVPGLTFASAWKNRTVADFDSVTVPVLSLDDALASKQAAGRPKDLLQVEQLLAAKNRRRK